MTELDPATRMELEAAAFRALMAHLLVKRAPGHPRTTGRN